MKQIFKNFFRPKDTTGSNHPISKKTGYIIVLGLIGLMIIILSNFFSPAKEEMGVEFDPAINNPQHEEVEVSNPEESPLTSDVAELEKNYEQDLEGMLNKIQGVTDAEVMVNLESTKVNIYEKNLIIGEQSTDENDRNGGTRKVEDHTEESQIVFVRQGDREVPLLVKTERPKVSGVFVVAKGADHATVKSWIVEAVSRVLDVPTHRVSVMPKS
ncbi:stage III sporulation protein AG [Oceanobacillus chungangensis]|uniref:Stage III sporulation protein AG n=1 Tax=Oceanobacillus chungangensis TaxID=1229152 RepID=A0A3D8Q0I1_9BACI|nr:stage III sporulation protein AG [Oceanobacillus chungangensis]RDW21960.1 stage III sporulation protein AG [Oceanobacillus chungangensis]